jgi:hypothetical protein
MMRLLDNGAIFDLVVIPPLVLIAGLAIFVWNRRCNIRGRE